MPIEKRFGTGDRKIILAMRGSIRLTQQQHRIGRRPVTTEGFPPAFLQLWQEPVILAVTGYSDQCR